MTELGLGAVQFGMPYGITNRSGQPPEAEVAAILNAAAASGIALIDTAAEYGASEETLGRLLAGQSAFRLITKLPRLSPGGPPAATQAGAALAGSLQRLRCTGVYGLLVHHADDLLGPDGDALIPCLEGLRSSGQVRKVGVSVYSPAQLDAVMARFTPDIVQAPLNVFDQRFTAAGLLPRLRAAGIEVHVRSIFLQGALLAPLEALPRHFRRIAKQIDAYDRSLRAQGLSRLAGALDFITQCGGVDVALVGVNAVAELAEIIGAWRSLPPGRRDYTPFAVNDDDIILPPRWRAAAAAADPHP